MDFASETGALILKAGATGNLSKLEEIKKDVGRNRVLKRICDEYSDFSTGRNVLHYAAETGDYDICRFLINVGVYIDALTYKRDTPLMLAAKEDHVKIVKYLINQGATVKLLNVKGYSALHYAVPKGNKELMELFLRGGASIDADTVDGTPLQIAISCGNVESVKFLLSRGAKRNSCFMVSDPPIICAVKSHSTECLKLLIEAGADPNQYIHGFSSLSCAAKEADTIFLNTLLEADADPNSVTTGPSKPIEEAALAYNREGVEILFPWTEKLRHYPDSKWSVNGIMEYCHSEEAKRQRDEDWRDFLAILDRLGHAAMRRKNYIHAIKYFKAAHKCDPSNAKWASKRSLCQAHAGRRMHALVDAEECLTLRPRLPGPRHGYAAVHIFKKFCKAGLVFMWDPYDKKFNYEFRPCFGAELLCLITLLGCIW